MKSGVSVLAIVAAAACALPAIGAERVAAANKPGAAAASEAPSPGIAAMERAAASRKFAMVFFWKQKDSRTDNAWGAVQPAVARLSQWAEVVPVQVTDPAEKALVDRYGADRAPMPMVLAIAPCGAVTGALTGEFDEAKIRATLVSPCTQLCLKALQDRKLVLVCVTDRTEPNGAVILPQGVQDFKADVRFASATEVVLLDSNDQGEAGFLKQLQVDPRTPRPLTVFLAPPGSVIGQFNGRATKEHFVAKLAAAQSNPCAGGKCGPNGCGPKR